MKPLLIFNLFFVCLINTAVTQTRVPRHNSDVLIPASDLIIIGRVQGRKYISEESRAEQFSTSKYVGELVELGVVEVLLDRINLEERLLEQGSTTVHVYVAGSPFFTDREVLFLPTRTYLVFLRRYRVEAGEATPLVVWNRRLRKWKPFPQPSATYFIVVRGGDGLVPRKERYLDFIQETRRLCYQERGRQ